MRLIIWLGGLQVPDLSSQRIEKKLEQLRIDKKATRQGAKEDVSAAYNWAKTITETSKGVKEQLHSKVQVPASVTSWNTQNLNFDSLIVACVIAFTLLLFLRIGL